MKALVGKLLQFNHRATGAITPSRLPDKGTCYMGLKVVEIDFPEFLHTAGNKTTQPPIFIDPNANFRGLREQISNPR